MTTQRGSRNEFRAIRGLLADAALDRAMIGLGRLDLALKNWETQPRAPAGQSDGGRWVTGPGGVPLKLPPTSWSSLRDGEPGADLAHQGERAQAESMTLEDGTRVLSIKIRDRRGQLDEQHVVIAPNGDSRIFETSGNTQTIRDGESWEVLSRTTFTPTQLIAEPIIRPAFLQAVPFALAEIVAAERAARTLELALSLLTAFSERVKGFGPALGFTAHEYTRDGQATGGMAIWVGQLNQQQLDEACPRNGEIRAITNEVARTVRASGLYKDRTDLGNKIHIAIRNRIRSWNDPDLKAELLVEPTGSTARANEKGNLRLDLLERVVANKIVCVYDYKTGKKGLSMDQALKLAAAAFQNYGVILRVIVIQMRPE